MSGSVFGGGLTLGQVGALARPAVPTGSRIGLPAGSGYVATNAVASNRMYAYPIPVTKTGSVSGVAIQVGTAVAGVTGILGLAASGPDGYPFALLGEAPAAVDMNSAANTELVASFSSNIPVSVGFVWALCVFNGSAQPVTLGSFITPSSFLGDILGNNSIAGYTSRGASGSMIQFSRAHTYGNAFPSTLTGWARSVAVPSSPVMVAVTA